MTEFCLRSVVLNGNLKNDTFLSYKFANKECENGVWHIAVKSVFYKMEQSASTSYVHICSNLVRDFKLKPQSSIKENFFPTIASFLISNRTSGKLPK